MLFRSSGLCHLIYEAVDNAVDEANAGYGKRIWVRLERDGWVTVRDEARGIPIDPKEYQGKRMPAATIILTVPHSGGKFDEGSYKTAGGLHGVGATVINATPTPGSGDTGENDEQTAVAAIEQCGFTADLS